jgi:hypothetical protein
MSPSESTDLAHHRPHSAWLTSIAASALRVPGCPVCNVVRERERTGLASVLWEQTTDTATTHTLIAARGYCFSHTWALTRAASSANSVYGLALLLHNVLSAVGDALEDRTADEAARWLVPRQACPACLAQQGHVRTVTTEIAALYGVDPLLATQAEGVLCKPHLAAVLPLVAADERANVASRVARRQDQVLRRGRLEDALEVAAGARPDGLPQAATACPACRAARLPGYVEQPGQRWHMCREHAWLLTYDAPNNLDPAQLAIASTQVCPLCSAARAARQPADTIGQLCLGHLRIACQHGDGACASAVAGADVQALATKLWRFYESAHYQFTGTLSLSESRSWQRALACIAGETAGVNLHAQCPSRRSWPERLRQSTLETWHRLWMKREVSAR